MQTPAGKPLPWKKRSLNEIDRIIVHHRGGPGTLDGIHKYYQKNRGWAGIPYHFAVTSTASGVKAYQLNDLSSSTWHARNSNRRSIGILVDGWYDAQWWDGGVYRLVKGKDSTVGDGKLGKLDELITHLSREWELQQKIKLEVLAHKDVTKGTGCPGIFLSDWCRSRP